jgi:hypothetical protein
MRPDPIFLLPNFLNRSWRQAGAIMEPAFHSGAGSP